MAALNIKGPAPAAAKPYGLWPEHWQSLRVFLHLRTELGRAAGPAFFLRLEGVPRAQWSEVFNNVQIMDIEASRPVQR